MSPHRYVFGTIPSRSCHIWLVGSDDNTVLNRARVGFKYYTYFPAKYELAKNKLITDTASLIITTVQSELSKGSLKMTTSYAQVVKDMSTIACPKPKSVGTTPVPAADPDSPVKPQQVLENIDEYLDREKRINNLIFHNLPELEATAPSPAERTQHDHGKICEILKDEFHLTGVAMKKCIRLGKPANNRPWLILVTLQYLQQKRDILRNAKQLRDSNKWGNIYISPDLTPKERDLGRKLRAELKDRRSNGETNLIIRRGQIITVDEYSTARKYHQPQRNSDANRSVDSAAQIPQPSVNTDNTD